MATPPSSMIGLASVQARRLGLQWVGDEHVLLAILLDESGSVASNVLQDLGLTAANYEHEYLERLRNTRPPVRSSIDRGAAAAANPRLYQLAGWVDGYAVACGVDPSPEIWLLAICYDGERPLAAGIDRLSVVQALKARGVPVPDNPPAADGELPSWRRLDVPVSAIHDIVGAIRREPGFVGFNTDIENDRAWVVVARDQPDIVDLVNAHLQRLAQQ